MYIYNTQQIAGLHNLYMIYKLGMQNSDSWKASRLTKMTSMDTNYSLPLNVAVITLQVVCDLRLLA